MSTSALRLYRPANGTEGEMFKARFCDRCERDREWRERERNPCEILTTTLCLMPEDEGYPTEWRYDDEGDPVCTAFVLVPEPALAIVGSVSLAGNAEAAQWIERALDYFKPARVVSGGANGIDAMARDAAERRGIPVTEHVPKVQRWLRNSPDGFWYRNLLIARDCSRLLCIRAKDAQTYGSGWTRDQARRMGKITHTVTIPDAA
jgi:hypothetical protein